MEEAHRVHKETTFGWLKLLQDLLAQGQVRPERGVSLWSERSAPASPLARPDESYTMIRLAFRPRI